MMIGGNTTGAISSHHISPRWLPITILRHAAITSFSLTVGTFAQPVIAASSAEAISGTSEAQESEASPGEIVVTARKRRERLKDIPESIAVLTSETLIRGGISSVDELGRQTPGLVLNRRLDDTPNVVIRGVGAFGNVQGVGFYVDEVQNFTDQTMRLEDLDSVEILKGPQGTLYGGSNIGGAIRYVSKKPTFDLSGQIKVEGGSRDYENLYGAINIPIVDGKIAIRASGYWAHDDGYIRNAHLGVTNSEREEYGFRGQLLVQPDERLTALLTLRYRNLDGSTFAYSRQNDVNHPLYESNTSFVPRTTRKTWAGIANLAYDLGSVDLVSITSYTRQDRTILWDLDYRPLVGLRVEGSNTRPIEIYTQELRLTSKNSETFDWIAGLYGSRIDNLTQNPMPINLSLFGGQAFLYHDKTTRQDDVAVFGTANARFGRFAIGAGLRLLRTKYSFASYVDAGVPVDPVMRLTTSDTALLPKFSLSYRLWDGTNIYVSAARGYESGKVSIDAVPPYIYKPETDWSFEAGAKGAIGSTLDYELAAYYILYDNRQIETRTLDAQGLIVERIDNIGKSTSKGIEGNFRWRPAQGLSLNAAAGYLDAKWDKAQFGLIDQAAPGGLRIIQLKGDRVPNAPKWNINFGASYSASIVNDLRLDLNADTAYTGSFRWKIAPSGISNFQRPYWVSNARIAIGAKNGGWQLAGRVENLFNVRYFYEFTPQAFGPQQADGTCEGCHIGSPASPRRFVATLSAKF